MSMHSDTMCKVEIGRRIKINYKYERDPNSQPRIWMMKKKKPVK